MQKTLVLNQDYYPLLVQPWQKGIEKIFKDKADVIDFYEGEHILCSGGTHYPRPSIIRMKKYINRSRKKVSFNKHNVFTRDSYTCQYCGNRFHEHNLTYDHVIPRSKWQGKGTCTCWTNIVTCCKKCNGKKADKTLKQARMTLLSQPVEPKYGEAMIGLRPWDTFPQEWMTYLMLLPSFKEYYAQR